MKQKHTSRAFDFALQLGSIITLVVTVVATILVIFGLIDVYIPDTTTLYRSSSVAFDAVRGSLATLFIFFPAYIVSMYFLRRRQRIQKIAYVAFSRWVLYIGLLALAISLLINATIFMLNFLDGELALRFICKSLTFFTVGGLVGFYYIREAREYWVVHRKVSRSIAVAVIGFVVALVVFVFGTIGSPTEARKARLDETQINDLTTIEGQVLEFYHMHAQLPGTLDVLSDRTWYIPVAPEGRSSYEYIVHDATHFSLCAQFETEYTEMRRIGTPVATPPYISAVGASDWGHGTGRVCFKRVLITEQMR